jgi:predicted negative regulator of RcsB-dependent stress response
MFGIFVVLLAAGLAVVGWMVWQFYKAGQPQKATAE